MVTNTICEIIMKYNFKYQIKAVDLWQLTMYSVYRSFLGPINIIFTVAMILLTTKHFMTVTLILKIGMILGVLVFILIQPLLIYFNSWKKVQHLPRDIEMEMDDFGVHIYSDNQKADIKWKMVKDIAYKPTVLVLVTSNQHGYILSNRVLKSQKNEIYAYVKFMLEETNK